MIDCDDLAERLHEQMREHVHLAVIADAVPVAEMHIDLAEFSEEQARRLEEACAEE